MSDGSRAFRTMRIGSFTLLLGLAWVTPGCRRAPTSGGTTSQQPAGPGAAGQVDALLLEDPPIRVKNPTLEAELFNDDEWVGQANDDYIARDKAKQNDYISLIAVKYNGKPCSPVPFDADSVTVVYGPKGGPDKASVTFTLKKDNATNNYKVNANFPKATNNKKKLELAGDENDFLRLVTAKKHGGGNDTTKDFSCTADYPTDSMVVDLY